MSLTLNSQRLPAHVRRVDEIEVEVHAFDHGVGREKQRRARGPGDYRGVVADPGLTRG